MKRIRQNPLIFSSALLFFLVFFGIGMALLVNGVRETWGAWRSQSWRTTTGTIISSEVDFNTDSDGDLTYVPLIKFEYLPDHPDYIGQTLASERVQFAQISTNNRDAVQETVDCYPIGSDVTVYINPSDPTDAVLEPGFTWSLLFFPLLGGVLTGVGGIFGYGIVKTVRRA